MSDINAVPAGAAPAPPAVPAAPIPGADAPAPYTPPPAVPAGGTPGYSGGGSTGGNAISRFFEGITVGDVVILGLSLCAFFLMIKFYRDKIKAIKEERTVVNDKLDQLTLEVDSMKQGQAA